MLEFDLGNPDLRFSDWVLPVEGQLFAVASDTIGRLPSFLIFNGVPMPKAMLLDGIILTALNALRVPAAYPIMLERIGDLSHDTKADDARAAELMKHSQFAEEGSVPEVVRDHLLRDIEPTPFAGGGELLLTAAMTPSLARMIEHLGSS